MSGRRVVRAAAIAAAIATAAIALSAYAFGGWAIITVDDLPETLVVSRPVTLSFVVRQHGVTPLDKLSPAVTATDGKSEVTARVTAGARGHYSSTLVLPRSGEWSITIHSGFRASRITLLPVRAIDPGAAAPVIRSFAERGERLFVAKGCLTCHTHGAFAGKGYQTLDVGPDLTPKRYEPGYLTRFLTDPSIQRTPGRSEMPALGLSTAELSALVAFINGDRPVATHR
jgi:mono/diheme cytochrome c family protein